MEPTAGGVAPTLHYAGQGSTTMVPDSHQDSHSDEDTQPKRKRAKPMPKSGTRITRNRKITSCLQCRHKKQKCDRVHPVCGNCSSSSSSDTCRYVEVQPRAVDAPAKRMSDAGSELASGSSLPRARNDQGTDDEDEDHERRDHSLFGGGGKEAFFAGPGSSTAFLERRRDLIAPSSEANEEERYREFEAHLRTIRASAIGEVLTDGHLTLPLAEEIDDLLQIYTDGVEWHYNIALVSLFRPRIHAFLRWWHARKTQQIPPDPLMAPLLLCMLALALQSTRTAPGYEPKSLGGLPWGDGTSLHSKSAIMRSSRQIVHASCSCERVLLVVAGKCMDTLQMVCPSNFSSAYQAPLDLIKAGLLRGLWHCNELNLQFSMSCFATTTRLAHAAGLHRDPSHWTSMSDEEAQGRRTLWWNVVFQEVFHSTRLGQPPGLRPNGFDTKLPTDYEAFASLYSRVEDSAPPKTWFEFHVARYKVARLFLLSNEKLFGLKIPRPSVVNSLDVIWRRWRDELPELYRSHFDVTLTEPKTGLHSKLNKQASMEGAEKLTPEQARVRFLQVGALQIGWLQGQVGIHRPFVTEGGGWKPPKEAQESLEKCVASAQSLIWLAASMIENDPPFMLINILGNHTFSSCCILSIHCRLRRDLTSAQLLLPTLERGIALLDTISMATRYGNVAEQAARFASTVRELMGGERASQRGAGGPGGAASQQKVAIPSSNSRTDGIVFPAVPDAGRSPFPWSAPSPSIRYPSHGTPFAPDWTLPSTSALTASDPRSMPIPSRNYQSIASSDMSATSHEAQTPISATSASQPYEAALSPTTATWLFGLDGAGTDRPLPPPEPPKIAYPRGLQDMLTRESGPGVGTATRSALSKEGAKQQPFDLLAHMAPPSVPALIRSSRSFRPTSPGAAPSTMFGALPYSTVSPVSTDRLSDVSSPAQQLDHPGGANNAPIGSNRRSIDGSLNGTDQSSRTPPGQALPSDFLVEWKTLEQYCESLMRGDF